MPTYVYRCKECGNEFEAVQKMSEEPLKTCPDCNGTVARLLFPPGIVFKGSGFHVNDYPGSKTASSAPASASEPAAKEESKPEPAASK